MALIDSVWRDRVLVVRIGNRSANAVTSDMAAELLAIVQAAPHDEANGAILLTGARGRHFCAGSDIAELQQLEDEGQGPGPLLEAEARAFDALAECPLPTLAAVDGAAMGGGVELAVCCDLIFASPRARFGLPEIRLGVFPALGATTRLVRRIGEARAREMMLTGDPVYGVEAQSWGLVNRLAEDGLVFQAAFAQARRLAHGPLGAVAQMKAALTAGRRQPEAEASRLALDMAKSNAGSPEVAEGLRAFLADEEPDFVLARKRQHKQ